MKYGKYQMKIATPLAIVAAFAVAVGLSAPTYAQTPSSKTGLKKAGGRWAGISPAPPR